MYNQDSQHDFLVTFTSPGFSATKKCDCREFKLKPWTFRYTLQLSSLRNTKDSFTIGRDEAIAMAPSKRAREETTSDLLQQLLKSDPSELAMVAADSRTLSALFHFTERLRDSMETTKRYRRDEEQAAQLALSKAKQARLIAANLCFECQKSVDGVLNPCVGFKQDGGGSGGDGVLLCEDCQDKPGQEFALNAARFSARTTAAVTQATNAPRVRTLSVFLVRRKTDMVEKIVTVTTGTAHLASRLTFLQKIAMCVPSRILPAGNVPLSIS